MKACAGREARVKAVGAVCGRCPGEGRKRRAGKGVAKALQKRLAR